MGKLSNFAPILHSLGLNIDITVFSDPASGFQRFQSRVDVMQFIDCLTSTFLYFECVIEGNKWLKWDIVLATFGNFL